MSYLKKLQSLLDKNTKKKLSWLVVFSVFLSMVEVMGISAIMPFIDIAVNFDVIHNNQYYQWAYDFFKFESSVDFAIVVGLALFGFYLFRGGVNLAHSYAISCFAEGLYAHVTKKLFKRYLSMPYRVFTEKNSSYLTKAIVTEALNISIAISSVLVMISEVFVVIFLYILMLITDYSITLIFTGILLMKVLFLTKTVSKKIKKAGKIRAEIQERYYEAINRVFSNFKHVKLQDEVRIQRTFIGFATKIDKYANANAMFNFLLSIPRLFIETAGFSLIIFLLITLLYLNQSDISYILPTLTLFVLALYRLMPSVNRIIVGYNTLTYFHKSVDIINDELKTSQEGLLSNPILFSQHISLVNVDFMYHKKIILRKVNLTINKGDKVAFIGESGSGKTTLVDLIIGLHRPDQGEICVDDVLIDNSNLQNWRSQIGYIPQQVYLFDGTIAENIFFGREENEDLLEKSLKQANIFDFLQTKQGVETLVGEGGVRLSGGQKQRIAIARALYGQPEVLVLDEATSALDDKIESKIMREIYQLSQDKTLIVVAHRLSTIEGCDAVYRIENGLLKQKG